MTRSENAGHGRFEMSVISDCVNPMGFRPNDQVLVNYGNGEGIRRLTIVGTARPVGDDHLLIWMQTVCLKEPQFIAVREIPTTKGSVFCIGRRFQP